MTAPKDLEPGERRMFEAFGSLREHVVQIVTDLASRVREGILAEDDGRFGPPSLADILTDLSANAGRVLTDVAGLRPEADEEDPDGEP